MADSIEVVETTDVEEAVRERHGGSLPAALPVLPLRETVAYPDTVSLEVAGRELIVTGERPVQETEGRVYEQLEIATGAFRRVVELSADVDAERAQATYEDGILRIELPLVTEGSRSHTVPIERGE